MSHLRELRAEKNPLKDIPVALHPLLHGTVPLNQAES